jgi:hypothetical protein
MKKIRLEEPIGKLVKTTKLKNGFRFSIVPLKGKKRILKKAIEWAKGYEIGFITKEIEFSKGIKKIKDCDLLEVSMVEVNKPKKKNK